MANGWLSPNGEFFPCPIGKHNIKAAEIIKDSSGAVINEVWIQVTMDSAFTEHHKITQAQFDWLVNSGQRFYVADAYSYEVIK